MYLYWCIERNRIINTRLGFFGKNWNLMKANVTIWSTMYTWFGNGKNEISRLNFSLDRCSFRFHKVGKWISGSIVTRLACRFTGIVFVLLKDKRVREMEGNLSDLGMEGERHGEWSYRTPWWHADLRKCRGFPKGRPDCKLSRFEADMSSSEQLTPRATCPVSFGDRFRSKLSSLFLTLHVQTEDALLVQSAENKIYRRLQV